MTSPPKESEPHVGAPGAAAARPAAARKPLGAFLLHTAFLTLLFAVLPSLDAVYAFGFKAAGNTLFGSFGERLDVEYQWVPPAERDSHGEIGMVGSVDARPAWRSRYSVRPRGYIPTALLVAAILATPGSRRRTTLALAGGVTGLGLLLLSQTALLALCSFAGVDEALVPLGGMLAASLDTIKALFDSPILRYAAVFAIYALVARPASALDLSAATDFLERNAPRPPPPPAG